MLDMGDSPIRRKVAMNALDPGKVLKTPPKTGADIFRETIVSDNISQYGPMSKNVSISIGTNQKPQPSAQAIRSSLEHLRSLPP